jgi:DNA-binding PadR family transcriptional regulator
MHKRDTTIQTIQYILLGLIQRGSCYGYTLDSELKQNTALGALWRVKQARLYAFLNQLEKEGYILGKVQHDSTRPARTEYNLTEKGKVAFTQWKSTPVQHPREIRQDFLARWYFATLDNDQEVDELVREQLVICGNWLRGIQQQLVEDTDREDVHKAILQFRLMQVKSIIDWLKNQ